MKYCKFEGGGILQMASYHPLSDRPEAHVPTITPPRHYLYGIHHIDICFEGRCTNKYLEMGIGYNIHLPNALY